MPQPSLTIQHLKTSIQYEGATKITRYWFEWSDRKQLSNLVARIDMLDEAGAVLSTTSVQLKKVKVTGYVPATETSPEKPTYDSSVWIQIDDVVREKPAASFRYYTVNLFKKSESVTLPMSGTFEDISHLS